MSLLTINLILQYWFTVQISLECRVTTGNLFDTFIMLYCPDIAWVSCHYWQFIWHYFIDLLSSYRFGVMSLQVFYFILLYCFTVSILLECHVTAGNLFDTTILFYCHDIACKPCPYWQFIWHYFIVLLSRYRFSVISLLAIYLTLLFWFTVQISLACHVNNGYSIDTAILFTV